MAGRREGLRRLQEEYRRLHADPPPLVTAEPNDSNLYEWYFVVLGPDGTDYSGGEYCGTIAFPPDYPLKPPRIRMLTPSGRFTPNAAICFSFSDFHPETWQPAWTVGTILTGLLSFMTTDEITTGSQQESGATRRRLARASREYNERHIAKYQQLFLAGHGRQALKKARRVAAELQAPVAAPSPPLPASRGSLLALLVLLVLLCYGSVRFFLVS